MRNRRGRNIILLTAVFMAFLCLMPFAQAEPVECEILSFSFVFEGQVKHAQIDNESNIITIVAPYGTDIKTQQLAPQIELPTGAFVEPPPRVPQDFSQLVTYTVTLWEGESPTIREYIVRVKEAKKAAQPVVESFTLLGAQGLVNELNKTILIELPAGTALTGITPVIAHRGVSVAPGAEEMQNFNEPVAYTFTLANGIVETYTVLIESV